MELCFVDVGQGSSGVILLGGRRAIVIDAGGKQSSTVVKLLQHFHIEAIECLVVTHNHDDHSLGAVEILTAFSKRITHIWCLYDNVMLRSLFWKRLAEEVKQNRLDAARITRLERNDKPLRIFESGPTYLDILAPTFMINVDAVSDKDANATSGILLFGNGSSRVIFAGDSTISEWQRIIAMRGRPFRCDFITTPHHAGAIWDRKSTSESQSDYDKRVESSLDWLFTSAVNAKYGIVSVGTNNQHGHPRSEVMSALRKAKILPICTQITGQCTDDLELHRRKALPIVLPSRSVLREDVNNNGRSRNVPCAATILVELQRNKVIIRRHADHQSMIDRLALSTSGSPLCRS